MARIKQIINGDDKRVQSGAIIEFTSEELSTLSNALSRYIRASGGYVVKNELRDIIHIASQISHYGHMDKWAVSVLSSTDSKEMLKI